VRKTLTIISKVEMSSLQLWASRGRIINSGPKPYSEPHDFMYPSWPTLSISPKNRHPLSQIDAPVICYLSEVTLPIFTTNMIRTSQIETLLRVILLLQKGFSSQITSCGARPYNV
jgi:hypothetical protein